jgi:hypothetical protein
VPLAFVAIEQLFDSIFAPSGLDISSAPKKRLLKVSACGSEKTVIIPSCTDKLPEVAWIDRLQQIPVKSCHLGPSTILTVGITG